MFGEGKNPNSFISFFLTASSSSSSSHLGFLLPAFISMADAGGSRLNIGALVEK
jgi:hypothetical protein